MIMKSKHYLNRTMLFRKSRKQYIKNQIVKAYKSKGRLFTTDHYVTPDSWWVDINFIGKNKDAVYACELINSLTYIHDKARDKAYKEADKIVPYDKEKEGMILKPSLEVQGAKTVTFKEQKYNDFGSLTRFEWTQNRIKELEKEVSVKEYIIPKYDYYHSIGLLVHLNMPLLNTDNINQFIVDFIYSGEKSYFGDEAIDFKSAIKPDASPKMSSEKESDQWLIDNDSAAIKNVPQEILDILGLSKYSYHPTLQLNL